jgi:hypothetical protein
MKLLIATAFALAAASSLNAQTVVTAPVVDLSAAAPVPGNWSFSPAPDGSEASFLDSSARSQLTIHCTRAARRVTISRPATTAAPFLFVWTSSQSRNLPASFNPATARISANLSAYDSLLDAIAFSRGRVGFTISGGSALVLPPWPEVARVIEDCRA